MRRAALKLKQSSRRQAIEHQAKDLTPRQAGDRNKLAEQQQLERAALKSAYLAQVRSVRQERARGRPTGLAAFLGRVTGLALVTKKLHAYRDRQRYAASLEQKTELADRQGTEQAVLSRRHELQGLEMQRKERALALVEKRERKALEIALLKEVRQKERARERVREPDRAVRERKGPEKKENRGRSLTRDWTEATTPTRKIDLRKSFPDSARGDEGENTGGGASEAPAPAAESKIRRRKRRKIRLEREFNKAADPDRDGRGDDSGGGPHKRRRRERDPPERDGPPRPRRTRKRDFDRGMWPCLIRLTVLSRHGYVPNLF